MTEAHLSNGHTPTRAAGDVIKLATEVAGLKAQVRAMDNKLTEKLKRKPPVRALPPARQPWPLLASACARAPPPGVLSGCLALPAAH